MVIIKALVLAAGYATRLYPLTLNTPKHLLPIGPKPMIEYILDKIGNLDAIQEIFIVTNSKFYNKFVTWARGYSSSKRIKIINNHTTSNENRLGAVGDIHFVVGQEKIDDELFVIAGDNLFEFSLRSFLNFYTKKENPCVAVYDIRDLEKAKAFGVIAVDEDNRIFEFAEKPDKPKSTLIATACYLFTKEDIKLLKEYVNQVKKPDKLGEFIAWLIKKKPVYGFPFKEKWFDIGSRPQYEEANEIYKGVS